MIAEPGERNQSWTVLWMAANSPPHPAHCTCHLGTSRIYLEWTLARIRFPFPWNGDNHLLTIAVMGKAKLGEKILSNKGWTTKLRSVMASIGGLGGVLLWALREKEKSRQSGSWKETCGSTDPVTWRQGAFLFPPFASSVGSWAPSRIP